MCSHCHRRRKWRARGTWPLLNLKPLHRIIIFAIENHFGLARWPPYFQKLPPPVIIAVAACQLPATVMRGDMTTYNLTHCMYSLKTLNIAHQLLVTLKASLNFYVKLNMSKSNLYMDSNYQTS